MPVDGSRPSLALLPVAHAVAAIWRARPRLLHVTAAPLTTVGLLQALDLAESDLAGFVLDHRTGDPAAVIRQAACESSTPLVIMATHGWTAQPSTLLGHVAEAVLRDAPCPLLLVGREPGRRFVPNHATLSRILLPLDGSVEAAAAMAAVAPLTARPEAAIDMLHVVPNDAGAVEETGAFTVPRYLDQPQNEWEAWRREFASRFQDGLVQGPPRVHVAVGNPGREIVAAARKQSSDLIVLTWKGVFDAGRAHALRTVLRDAPCPILVVHTGPSATAAAVEHAQATPARPSRAPSR